MKQMKFVEWPVVLKMPRLSDVLYTGHKYEGVSTMSDFFNGLNHTTGAPENSTYIFRKQAAGGVAVRGHGGGVGGGWGLLDNFPRI